MAKPQGSVTLCLDIGGTGIKAMTVDEQGQPTSDRVRQHTPPACHWERPAHRHSPTAHIEERCPSPFTLIFGH